MKISLTNLLLAREKVKLSFQENSPKKARFVFQQFQNSGNSLEAIWAGVFLVINNAQVDLKEGIQLLEDALEILKEAAKDNQKLGRYCRDILLIKANLFYAEGSFKSAEKAYLDCLEDESKMDRKIPAYLNLARLYFFQGQLFQSLKTIQKAKLHNPQEDRYCQHLILLETRIHLILGISPRAHEMLQLIVLPADDQIALESKYLNAMAAFDLATPIEFANSFEDLVKFCHGNICDEKSAAFYQFEWQCYLPFLFPKQISSKRTYLDRGRNFSTMSGNRNLMPLLKHIHDLVLLNKFESLKLLIEQLEDLKSNIGDLMYQTLMLLVIQFLNEQKKNKEATQSFFTLDIYFDRLMAGFSEHFKAQYRNQKKPKMDQLMLIRQTLQIDDAKDTLDFFNQDFVS